MSCRPRQTATTTARAATTTAATRGAAGGASLSYSYSYAEAGGETGGGGAGGGGRGGGEAGGGDAAESSIAAAVVTVDFTSATRCADTMMWRVRIAEGDRIRFTTNKRCHGRDTMSACEVFDRAAVADVKTGTATWDVVLTPWVEETCDDSWEGLVGI